MGGNGSHSSGSGTGWDFPPVFLWDWDGKRLIFVGVGRERFENSLPCHPLVSKYLMQIIFLDRSSKITLVSLSATHTHFLLVF